MFSLVFLGNADICEAQRAGVGGTVAHFLLGLADLEAGSIPGNDQNADAAAAFCIGIGLGGDQEGVGISGVGNEGLGTVDDVLITVQDRCGLGGSCVGTGLRLGQRECAEGLAGSSGNKVFLLLLFGTGVQQGHGTQRSVRIDNGCQGRRMSCDLLHDQDIAQVVHPGSAVLFGNADAQESQLAAHLDFVHREGMCLVEFTDGLGDGIVGEIFGQCLDCQLIFCQKVFVFHVILLVFHGFNVFCTHVGIGCYRVLGVWVIDVGCRV